MFGVFGSFVLRFSHEWWIASGRLIEPNETLLYKRPLPGPEKGKRTLLNFEAVDYETTEGFQLHGKQKLQPGGVWCTRVTGNWRLTLIGENIFHWGPLGSHPSASSVK